MASTTTREFTPDSTLSPIDKPGRLVSLDVFRGITVAAMILVTNPGTYSSVYWPLLHAEWRGWTLTDMIFPSFLFIVGVAMTLSFSARTARGESRGRLALHLVQRAAILILIGLFLNGFPFFDLHTLRIPGVLQRIALCYLGGGLLYLWLTPSTGNGDASQVQRRVAVLGGVVAMLVLGYWLTLRYCPVPGFGPDRFDSLGNLGAYIDRAVFTTRHMWPYGTTPGYGVTFDPEGLLSTLPATANLLIGLLAGELLRTARTGGRKTAIFAVSGAALFCAGMALGPALPIVKKIWTSSFVLLSTGFSLMAFALSYWVLDVRRWLKWTRPLVIPGVVFGTNAILAFALTNIITPLTDVTHTPGGLRLHDWGYRTIFLPWLSPVRASLAYALALVGLNLAIVSVFYRRKIFLRI
jgi:predicted acyltransferase